ALFFIGFLALVGALSYAFVVDDVRRIPLERSRNSSARRGKRAHLLRTQLQLERCKDNRALRWHHEREEDHPRLPPAVPRSACPPPPRAMPTAPGRTFSPLPPRSSRRRASAAAASTRLPSARTPSSG